MLHINLTCKPALKVLHLFVVLPPQLQAATEVGKRLETSCAFQKRQILVLTLRTSGFFLGVMMNVNLSEFCVKACFAVAIQSAICVVGRRRPVRG